MAVRFARMSLKGNSGERRASQVAPRTRTTLRHSWVRSFPARPRAPSKGRSFGSPSLGTSPNLPSVLFGFHSSTIPPPCPRPSHCSSFVDGDPGTVHTRISHASSESDSSSDLEWTTRPAHAYAYVGLDEWHVCSAQGWDLFCLLSKISRDEQR